MWDLIPRNRHSVIPAAQVGVHRCRLRRYKHRPPQADLVGCPDYSHNEWQCEQQQTGLLWILHHGSNKMVKLQFFACRTFVLSPENQEYAAEVTESIEGFVIQWDRTCVLAKHVHSGRRMLYREKGHQYNVIEVNLNWHFWGRITSKN